LDETVSNQEVAGGTVYRGTAGIGLFLMELWNCTQDSELRPVVFGAAEHAREAATSMPPDSVGFFSGRVGVAYFLARLSVLTGDARFVHGASDVLAPIAGHEKRETGNDVIAGGAGAIPALLIMSGLADMPRALDHAVALGERLIDRAHRGPTGWWWSTRGEAHMRGLTGLAHGAAGFGYGLLELYAATGDTRFRYAAEQAYLYEESLFAAAVANWPDLRNVRLGTILSTPNGWSELRAALRAGECFPRANRSFMTAWCHGSAGIGLSRIRAFQLLGDDRYADQARVAVETTSRALRFFVADQEPEDCTYCHGMAGRGELLLTAARELGDSHVWPLLRAAVSRAASVHEHRGERWPSGISMQVPDRSLLLGDAGVGHFLLRLHSCEVPSVLLLTVPPTALESRAPAIGAIDVDSTRDVDLYFERTFRVLHRLSPSFAERRGSNTAATRVSSIAAAYASAAHALEAEPDAPRRALLADAMAPELARYRAALAFTDLTEELEAALRRPSDGEIDLAAASYVRTAHTQVIECEHDWDAWLAGDDTQPPDPAEIPVVFVLFRRYEEVHCLRVGQFAHEVLRALARPATLALVAAETRELLAAEESVDGGAWRSLVEAQVHALRAAGMIEACWPAADGSPTAVRPCALD
jgi:hypothetical protein